MNTQTQNNFKALTGLINSIYNEADRKGKTVGNNGFKLTEAKRKRILRQTNVFVKLNK